MARRRPKWVKRDDAPRWARLLSWIVGAVVWLWIINGFVVRDWPPTSVILANPPSASLVIDSLFFVLVATVVAAFVMLLIRFIGRAWRKLRT